MAAGLTPASLYFIGSVCRGSTHNAVEHHPTTLHPWSETSTFWRCDRLYPLNRQLLDTRTSGQGEHRISAPSALPLLGDYDVAVARECEVEGCGVLAVGLCHRCKRGFCQSHQARIGSPVKKFVDLCMPCRMAEEAETSQRVANTKAANEALLTSIPAPFARACAAFALYGQSPEATASLCQIWPTYEYGKTPWKPDEVATWFASEAVKAGLPLDGSFQGWSWRKRPFRQGNMEEDNPREGWVFLDGSTKSGPGENSGRCAAYVFPNGEYALLGDRLGEYTTGNFTASALARMAVLLNLIPSR